MLSGRRISPRFRIVLGVAISLVLLALVFARVDVASVALAIANANPALIGMAVFASVLDQAIRAARWRLILRPVRDVPIGAAFAFQAIGYLGNAALPARLGDLARAHLAGTAFAIPRLTALGSIVAERLLDGSTMLALAGISSLLVVTAGPVRQLVGFVVAIGAMATLLFAGVWLVLKRFHPIHVGPADPLREFVSRIGLGLSAFRDPARATPIVVVTIVTELVGALLVLVATRAVGLELSPVEAVLLISALALSLAIPAAPGGWGTYEFAGLTVLTALGHGPNVSLAAILIARATTTLPQVAFGLMSLMILGIRPSSILANGVESEAD